MVPLPGDPLPEVRRQPAAADGLSAGVVQHGRRAVDLDSRRVGRRGADRAPAHRRACAQRHPKLRIFLSTTTMAAQQLARRSVQDVDAVFYFPFDLGAVRAPHARPGEAAAVPDDGDRDLAEPAARVPAPRRQDRGRQRPAVAAVVPALPAGARLHPARARRHRSLLRAERGVGAALHRARRRPPTRHRHRQPEVRLARAGRTAAPRGARPRAALLPLRRRPGR